VNLEEVLIIPAGKTSEVDEFKLQTFAKIIAVEKLLSLTLTHGKYDP